MPERAQLQTPDPSPLFKRRLCSFDAEIIEAATTPLLHQASRFLLVNAGLGRIKIQGREYDLRPSSLVAVLPWEITEVTAVESTLQYFLLVYQFDALSEVLKTFYNVGNAPLSIIHDLEETPVVLCQGRLLSQVQEIFQCMREELGSESLSEPPPEQEMQSVYLCSKLAELMVLFRRAMAGGKSAPQQPRALHNEEIFRYIYTHLSEKLTLDKLSKLFYRSPSSLSTVIKETTGLSFNSLLNEARVGKTISYLLYTDLTLEELAGILGYTDASHLSKVFAAKVGMRANEYRRTYQALGSLCRVKESKKVYQLVSYLAQNYSEELTAKEVAAQFGVSIPELNRMLLYGVEKNFEDFLHQLRINRACELLLTTPLAVADIAAEVGYRNVKTLHRNFVRLKKQTPGEFRNTVTLQRNSLGS